MRLEVHHCPQGRCECRNNMRWNTEAREGQVNITCHYSPNHTRLVLSLPPPQTYIDVDCSNITSPTTNSTTIQRAIELSQYRQNATKGCLDHSKPN